MEMVATGLSRCWMKPGNFTEQFDVPVTLHTCLDSCRFHDLLALRSEAGSSSSVLEVHHGDTKNDYFEVLYLPPMGLPQVVANPMANARQALPVSCDGVAKQSTAMCQVVR